MGRGRAKAKQQKVARELKYNNQFTDLDALQRELGASDSGSPTSRGGSRDDGANEDSPDEDYENWSGSGR